MNEIFEKYETPYRFIPSIGEFVDEYKILELLGEGAFGIVYKVSNKNGDIQALKLIKLWEIAYEKDRKAIIARFIREFKISNIDSRYLVKSFSYGKILGNPYITMQYCNGGSLQKWNGRFSANKNHEKLATHILKGLNELHKDGYVHRDIKPDNILLVDDENRAKLADFGIAGDKNSKLTVTNMFGKPNQIFGTWAYLAPEQENNSGGKIFKALNSLSDIFSFGVTIFELFTGELPFPPYHILTQADLVEYRMNVKKGNWMNLELKRKMIPPKWMPVLQKCLEPDFQKKRFKNISEIFLSLGYDSFTESSTNLVTNPDALALTVTYGEELNKTYNLSELQSRTKDGILTIGRKDGDISNIIEIAENQTSFISRRHATLEKWESPKCWRIRDGQWTKDGWKASLNSLFVNSQHVGIAGVKIEAGDIITMGDTILKVVAQ